ncbi:MAG: bifunctional oligoribonuclease/PAP phosphatase NrnA, partial [Candidatus Eisenbacteria bacterium]|nr:bifunctional oligoribonuclease/PAP phosphatase NrnA [Candidatus Eisenbacteria bacterium]
MFESLVEQMRRARGVLLTTHECPDGDGIGCLLALDQVLRARGTRTELL